MILFLRNLISPPPPVSLKLNSGFWKTIFLIMGLPTFLNAQLNEGSLDGSIVVYEDHPDHFYIRTHIHFVETSTTPGWISPTDALDQANDMLNLLNEAYNKHNIYFVNGQGNGCLYTSIDFVDLPEGVSERSFNFYSGFVNNFTGDKGLHIFVVSNEFTLDNQNGLFGYAFSAPSNIALVAGKENGTPVAVTPVLVHEVGHCLGLLHPSESHTGDPCPSFVNCPPNPTPGQCCNDFVEDTPTQDNLICGQDPFAQNYMVSADNWACRDFFTEGQVKRMREYLKSYNIEPFLQEIQILPANIANVVSGNIVVESGTELVIASNQVVNMLPGAYIHVKKGGILKVYGILTGACGKMWQGIIVEGNSNDHDQTDTQQGRVFVWGEGKIEHAKVGVDLEGFAPLGTGGGIVACLNGHWVNNTVGIRFGEYFGTYSNRSKLIGGKFTANDNYRGSVIDNIKHVSLVSVKGVKMQSCEFLEERISCNQQTTGIEAKDATFYATSANKFTSLFKGIYASSLSNASGGLVITDNIFDGCGVGVETTSFSTASIARNQFILKPPYCDNTKPMGISVNGLANEFKVASNNFSAPPFDPSSLVEYTGIYSKGTMNGGDHVYQSNTYTNMYYGNVAEGVNGNQTDGLSYLCNNHNKLEELPPGAYNYWVKGTIRYNQGAKDGDNFDAAGNIFGASYGSFSRINSPGYNINYHYYPDIEFAQNPRFDYVGTNQGCTSTVNPVDRPINRLCDGSSGEPGVTELATRFYQARQKRQSKLDSLQFVTDGILQGRLEREARFLKMDMNTIAARVIQFYRLDSVQIQSDSIIQWLYRAETFETWLQLAKYYYFSNDLTAFDEIWQNISNHLEMDANIFSAYNNLDELFQHLRPSIVANIPLNNLSQENLYYI